MLSVDERNIDSSDTARQLIILVPDSLENAAAFARQVYWQAINQKQGVTYLALNNRETDELATARLLSTLMALTQSGSVAVNIHQAKALDWTGALRQVAQPGDLVLVPEPQISLPVTTAGELEITIKQLPSENPASADDRSHWFTSALYWLAGLAIFVGFSFLEVRVAGQTNGALRKAILIILVLVEFGLIAQWNRLLNWNRLKR